jgi:DNA-binding winged helix-turn-helix (wHTH) protein
MAKLTNEHVVKFGPFEADLNTRELWKSGVRLKLGGQPFEILALLVERRGQLVTREELRKRIWVEDTFVDFNHGLNAAVNKLREVLGDSAEDPRYIETLPRRGYRFIAKIEEPGPVHPHNVPVVETTREANWRGDIAGDDWQAKVPVKRQTLVYAWTFLALIALATAVVTKLWLEWRNPERSAAAEREMKFKLAAERTSSHAPGIWQLDVSRAADPLGPTLVTSSPEAIAGPQPSPDGRKLAFMAGRNENMEIWVSNLDGSSAAGLTNLRSSGTPRWSPDSRWIAFDGAGSRGEASIFVISAAGGPVRAIVDDQWNNMVPSWSRDGKWIYFASNRAKDTLESQVWKVSLDTGRLVQVTRNGGFSAYESPDGKTLYYAKTRYTNPEIWQVPVAGGAETRVSSLLRPSTWANWALAEKGILFLSEYNEKASTLEYFDFATRGVRPLGTLENASFWLSASSDGKSVWYSELTQEQAHLVFRKEDH